MTAPNFASGLTNSLGQSRKNPPILSSVNPLAEELRPLIKDGGAWTGPEWEKARTELLSVCVESDPQLFFLAISQIARKLEDRKHVDQAAALYGWLAEKGKVPSIKDPLVTFSQSAESRLQILKGEGNFGGRFEILMKRTFAEATDARVIFPMVAASSIYNLGRTAMLRLLAADASGGWHARGMGARALSSLTGYALEVPAFVSVARGLRQLSPGSQPIWTEELYGAAATLGILKLAGFAGNQAFLKAQGINEEAASRLTGLTAIGRQATSQFSTFLGLWAAQRWEGNSVPTVAGTLATMIGLGAGSQIANRLLGSRFRAFHQELGARAEIFTRFAEAKSRLRPAGILEPQFAHVMMMSGDHKGEGGSKPGPSSIVGSTGISKETAISAATEAAKPPLRGTMAGTSSQSEVIVHLESREFALARTQESEAAKQAPPTYYQIYAFGQIPHKSIEAFLSDQVALGLTPVSRDELANPRSEAAENRLTSYVQVNAREALRAGLIEFRGNQYVQTEATLKSFLRIEESWTLPGLEARAKPLIDLLREVGASPDFHARADLPSLILKLGNRQAAFLPSGQIVLGPRGGGIQAEDILHGLNWGAVQRIATYLMLPHLPPPTVAEIFSGITMELLKRGILPPQITIGTTPRSYYMAVQSLRRRSILELERSEGGGPFRFIAQGQGPVEKSEIIPWLAGDPLWRK